MSAKPLRGVALLGGGFLVAACTMVDLPPVPPKNPYQSPANLANPSAHGQGKLTVAIPENRPPYFNGAHDDGIERDIIREAFEQVGEHPEFMATADRQKKYDSGRFNIECVSTISEDFKLKSETYFTDPVVSYHYTPFTLKKSGIVIRKYEDLAGKNVEAFSFASKYLGPSFANMIPRMAVYAEHLNRSSQVALLLRGLIDVLVIDRIMFHFIRDNLVSVRADDYDAEFVEGSVDKVIDFKMACHDKEIVEMFNKGLAMLRARNRPEDIFAAYCARTDLLKK